MAARLRDCQGRWRGEAGGGRGRCAAMWRNDAAACVKKN